MRRVTALFSAATVVLTAAGLAAQGKPGSAGDWKMLPPGGGHGDPGVDLVITQSATAMTVEYPRGPAPAAPKLTYKLDGSVSRNTIAGRGGAPTEQVFEAMWAGNNIVVTTEHRQEQGSRREHRRQADRQPLRHQ